MPRLTTFLSLTLITAFSLMATSAVVFENENLLIAMPKSYKPDYRANNARGRGGPA